MIEGFLKTITVMYLTLIHAALIGGCWLYTSNDYTLAKIDHGQQEQAYNTDDYNALLDSHLKKRGK